MKQRSDILKSDQWNTEALYSSKQDWDVELQHILPDSKHIPRWPEFASFQGTLHQGPQQLKQALDMYMHIDRKLSKLMTYAHLKHDEDITETDFKNCYEQILTIMHHFAEESSWLQPEIMSLPDTLIEEYLSSPCLESYRFFLEKMVRLKKHTLSIELEKLMALSGQTLQTAHKTFSAINDADFKFPSVVNNKGDTTPLSHGTYALAIRDQDRILRENAFKTYHKQYISYENTLCELLSGQMQNHLFNAKARNFSSCLEAALYPKNIDTSVYFSLIDAVHEKIDVLHRYIAFRKRVLKVPQLHMYDLYVPLTSAIDIKLSYDEAEALVIDSVAPLGSEYQNTLKKGFYEDRWVDRYENANKRSGAYSSGCFDSMPYILMNYKSLLRDVFTLAHEAGHSMHSFYSRTTQPYHMSDYPIFLAEVASTFNEDLLSRHLVKNCRSKEEKIFLINQKLEDIRGTLFRQTMFAEFELFLHKSAEEGIPLTPKLLNQTYHALNEFYFGQEAVIDAEIDIEWARIPHFYYNFYVFQYATGISAALALTDKVFNGQKQDRDAYLAFLKGGSSKYPLDMLEEAGVNMRHKGAVCSAIAYFESLLNELETLIEDK